MVNETSKESKYFGWLIFCILSQLFIFLGLGLSLSSLEFLSVPALAQSQAVTSHSKNIAEEFAKQLRT
ncbi:MAG TPA: hypothetical protein VGA94_07115, partial [Thermodesulfobacteriota bacterium]